MKRLSKTKNLVLTAIAYLQSVTRGELSGLIGKEVSRDTIHHLRGLGFIASGARSPEPEAPYTDLTTKGFLAQFGFGSLRELPDMKALEDAGLLSKDKLLAGEIPVASRSVGGDDDVDEEEGQSRARVVAMVG